MKRLANDKALRDYLPGFFRAIMPIGSEALSVALCGSLSVALRISATAQRLSLRLSLCGSGSQAQRLRGYRLRISTLSAALSRSSVEGFDTISPL